MRTGVCLQYVCVCVCVCVLVSLSLSLSLCVCVCKGSYSTSVYMPPHDTSTRQQTCYEGHLNEDDANDAHACTHMYGCLFDQRRAGK